MLNFTINQKICSKCGQCAADCPANIITLEHGYPEIPLEKEAECYQCQHCFAVCTTGALSILGLKAENSLPLRGGGYPTPEQLETLMKGRRTVRRYRDENLDPKLLQHLLEVAWHAPPGKNCRQVQFTVIDDREKMAAFRKETFALLAQRVREGKIPAGLEFFATISQMWEEKGIDILFRGAPHLLVASTPKEATCPTQDCLIAMTYFELFAQANSIGTVWDGLATWAFTALMPEMIKRLGIPADHHFGYAMAFGKPAVHYARTVQHAPALISRFPG